MATTLPKPKTRRNRIFAMCVDGFGDNRRQNINKYDTRNAVTRNGRLAHNSIGVQSNFVLAPSVHCYWPSTYISVRRIASEFRHNRNEIGLKTTIDAIDITFADRIHHFFAIQNSNAKQCVSECE